MNLTIISLLLFFAMKLIYSNWGDYTSHYWALVYYSALYFMIASLLKFIRELAYTKLQKQFFGLGSIYFGALLLVHLACFINIELYVKLITDVGRITTGVVVLSFGVLIINYLRLKSHDNKN